MVLIVATQPPQQMPLNTVENGNVGCNRTMPPLRTDMIQEKER